jgi:ABC-type spermidine/putrescine transport system permease subunit II
MRLGFNFWLGAGLTTLVILAGILAPWIAPFDPVLDADLMNSELPPDATFWFGTDGQGRDVYTRILYGAQISLTVGIVSQVINSIIGVTLGMTAGYWGGWWDDLVNGFTNVMLAIPSLIFALAVMAVLGPGLPSLLIALGLTNWSWTCRIARSSHTLPEVAGLCAGGADARLRGPAHHVHADPAQHDGGRSSSWRRSAWARRCFRKPRSRFWASASSRRSRAGARC